MPARKSYSGKKVVLLGAGNVAHYLALELTRSGNSIMQVYSPTGVSAKKLGKIIGSPVTSRLHALKKDADFYILAVKDDALPSLAKKLRIKKGMVLHTSGTVSMDVLKYSSQSYGVLYPVQTFRAGETIHKENVPVCIESNNLRNEKILAGFARSVSSDIHVINSEQRKKVHLAAVFACNFSNHLYSIAEKILRKENQPLKLLLPLIRHTAEKIRKTPPSESQTGPARRNDIKTQQEQLNLLKSDKELQSLYKLFSRRIAAESKPA